MPKFKFKDYENIKETSVQRQYISDFLAKECGADDPVFLSDLLVRKNNVGGHVMVSIEQAEIMKHSRRQQPSKWKIKVLCDEWGNILKEGDKVVRRILRPLKNPVTGKLTSPQELSMAKLDGSFNKEFTDVKEFVLDEKGCISCEFEDAGSFLNINGVHAATNKTLTTKPRSSREPLETPNGQKLHKHHWRYKEITKAEYAKLNNVGKRKEPLRGIDPKEEVEAYHKQSKKNKGNGNGN